MADLFQAFWWLLFPVVFSAMGAFRLWLDWRARLELTQTLRAFAENGLEPPAALLNQLNR
ncbi:hypothetical protein CA606_04475 [Caulobacter vibrioides]|uniref:MotA/TolQ/ExbB proton channel family protein n=1 Tax=Caulobacter vibrioides TaxID=155892 RepID=A0A290MWS9_CAUVI|nr:hypothetical protein [Caulobacter vibrioides]ATC31670.1 hypothetical protein CA606_04475 [Caulobacter vibrioides]